MTSTHPSFSNGYSFAQSTQVNGNGCSSLQRTPNSRAGRKRSRDEAAIEDENDYFQPASEPEPENEDEWVYGEGMTLIRPNGRFIEASSQTGTWAEEKAEAEKAKSRPQTPDDRPILRSHKSQRLGLTATPAISEGTVLFAKGASNSIPSSPPKSATVEPTVDDFTIHLGIGWSRISEDEHIQAAARGWAKFIENHFPVSNVNIRLQSKGLASYLVEASEGYFLFGEDLKQGRLVSTSLEKTFRNLQSRPPVFDGMETMDAAATPKPEEGGSFGHFGSAVNGNANGFTASNASNGFGVVGARGPAGQSVEVEMDMS